MNAQLTHPGFNHRLDYRRCIDTQVDTLAEVVRKGPGSYGPMVLR
jgi:hypothetical protein